VQNVNRFADESCDDFLKQVQWRDTSLSPDVHHLLLQSARQTSFCESIPSLKHPTSHIASQTSVTHTRISLGVWWGDGFPFCCRDMAVYLTLKNISHPVAVLFPCFKCGNSRNPRTFSFPCYLPSDGLPSQLSPLSSATKFVIRLGGFFFFFLVTLAFCAVGLNFAGGIWERKKLLEFGLLLYVFWLEAQVQEF